MVTPDLFWSLSVDVFAARRTKPQLGAKISPCSITGSHLPPGVCLGRHSRSVSLKQNFDGCCYASFHYKTPQTHCQQNDSPAWEHAASHALFSHYSSIW